jgi:hypothetical protein
MKKLSVNLIKFIGIFSFVLISSCGGESREPAKTETEVPSKGILTIDVSPSEEAADEECHHDKYVILELDADYFSTKKTVTLSYKYDATTYYLNREHKFKDLRAGAYTLTIKYRKGTSGTIIKKQDYSINLTENHAKNGTELYQEYYLTKNDICY